MFKKCYNIHNFKPTYIVCMFKEMILHHIFQNNMMIIDILGTDGRVVKAVDLSPTAVMRVGSIPTLCNFYITDNKYSKCLQLTI
jgi:hypothetical protein